MTVKSLAMKLAMLVATLVIVALVGWPVPDPVVDPEPLSITLPEAMESPTPSPATPSDALTVAAPSAAPGEAGSHPREPEPVARGAADRRLDLNIATGAELERLPGIGPKLAQRILEHRHAHGPFLAPQELLEVKGIGQKKYERVHPLVTVKRSAVPRSPKAKL